MYKQIQSLKKFAALTLLLSATGIMAQAKDPTQNKLRDRVYTAYPVSSAPVIDGKLEKNFWDKLPAGKYFTVNDLNTDSVTRQTTFRIGYDAKNIYVAITSETPPPPQPMNSGDQVEFQFIPPGKTTPPSGDW